jgi:hypothetical protein
MGVLGISLGTTTVGIAYINERELYDFNTHSFRAEWSEKKADAIVNRIGLYFTRYAVGLVVIKVPPKTHQPASIKLLLQKLGSFVAYKGCMADVCTKQDLKRHIPGAKNHKDVMSFVVQTYPITTTEYSLALQRKNQYHKKVFEAIIAAHIGKEKGG